MDPALILERKKQWVIPCLQAPSVVKQTQGMWTLFTVQILLLFSPKFETTFNKMTAYSWKFGLHLQYYVVNKNIYHALIILLNIFEQILFISLWYIFNICIYLGASFWNTIHTIMWHLVKLSLTHTQFFRAVTKLLRNLYSRAPLKHTIELWPFFPLLSQQNPDTNGNLRKRMNYSSQQESRSQQRAQSTTNISGVGRARPLRPLTTGANGSSSTLSRSSPKSESLLSVASSSAQLVKATPQAAASTPDVMAGTPCKQNTSPTSLQHLLAPKLERIQMMGNKLELKQTPCSQPTTAGMGGTSKIDKYARILFPVSFGAFNMVYWVVYLSKDTMVAKGG